MTEKVHEHGSLAGVELWYGGASSSNLDTREIAMDIDSVPNLAGNPYQTRRMDKFDIKEFKRWHRNAALRAKEAGFDVVYVYATHGYLLSRFLSPNANTRTDEYGGNLENRVRLVRELIEENKGTQLEIPAPWLFGFRQTSASATTANPFMVSVTICFGMLAELPDLWDINIKDYSLEMGVSRFIKEGSLEPYMSYVKITHNQAGCHSGKVHIAGCHGIAGQAWCGRFYRCSAPVNRGPVLTQEDRGRTSGGHPRMYRVQHLLHWGRKKRPDPVHSKSSNR